MALAGRKPTPSAIRLVTGTRGRRKPGHNEPQPDGRPVSPVKLTGRPAVYWRRYIAPAHWLTRTDSAKAFMWVHLSAEYEASVAPGAAPMLAARIAQLRNLGAELGMDPASRARLGGAPQTEAPDSYFD